MTKLKKLLALGLIAALSITSLVACGKKEEEKAEETKAPVEEKEEESKAPVEEEEKETVYKIGIAQLVDHDSLDAARDGFIDGLEELGYVDGKNIEIDYQNAQGASANNDTIATQFLSDKKDLILAIATPTAQSMANKIKDIPILVTAVTDPAGSKLVESNEMPNCNVSGTSDLAPIDAQISLIKEIQGDVETIGLLYCSSEDNSILQIEMAKAACDELGIKYVEATVTNANDITQVVTNLATKVDAIYSPTDNVIASAMPNVRKIADEAKVPTYTGWAAEGDKGGMAARALSYYELGKVTAKQAVAILTGEAKIEEMPIGYQEEFTVTIDKANAELLGIEIPENL